MERGQIDDSDATTPSEGFDSLTLESFPPCPDGVTLSVATRLIRTPKRTFYDETELGKIRAKTRNTLEKSVKSIGKAGLKEKKFGPFISLCLKGEWGNSNSSMKNLNPDEMVSLKEKLDWLHKACEVLFSYAENGGDFDFVAMSGKGHRRFTDLTQDVRDARVRIKYKEGGRLMGDLKIGNETLENVFLPYQTQERLKNPIFGKILGSIDQDGKKIFCSQPFEVADGRLCCHFYVHVGNKLLVRLAYKSKSHQRWRVDSAHIGPFLSDERSYGKGRYSYATETIPCPKLEQLLESVEGQKSNEIISNTPFVDWRDFDTNTYEEEIGLDEPLPGIEREALFSSEYYPADFTCDFSRPINTRTRPPSEMFPSGFTTEDYEFTYRGVALRVTMAHDPDGRVWVDRLEKTGVPINSYGIKSKVLDLGILHRKPIEYLDQVPHGLKSCIKEIDTLPAHERGSSSRYVDITLAFDSLPFIQKFREQRKIQRVA